MKILLDTNILLRAVQANHPAHSLTLQTLNDLIRNGRELSIGLQSVVEFWVVLTRPAEVNGFGLTATQARTEVDVVLDTYTLLPNPPDLLNIWLDICTRYSVQGRQAHDARLAALMLAHNIKSILTFNNRDFDRFSEIEVIHPKDVEG